MQYQVIEIAEGDARVAGSAIYKPTIKKAAIAQFHKKLGTAMNSDLYTRDLVMVIDRNGRVVKREVYDAAEEEESAEE